MRSGLPNTLISSLALPPASCVTNGLTFLALRSFIYIVGRLPHDRVPAFKQREVSWGHGVALFYLHFFCFDKNTPMKSNFWGNGFVWLTDLD